MPVGPQPAEKDSKKAGLRGGATPAYQIIQPLVLHGSRLVLKTNLIGDGSTAVLPLVTLERGFR